MKTTDDKVVRKCVFNQDQRLRPLNKAVYPFKICFRAVALVAGFCLFVCLFDCLFAWRGTGFVDDAFKKANN